LRAAIKIFLVIAGLFVSAPAVGQTVDEETRETKPLRVTIRPLPKFRFGDVFSYGSETAAPRVEELFVCPPGTLFTCEIFRAEPLEKGDPFTIRLNRVVAAYVYEKSKGGFGRPDTGFLMGGRYYGLPRYVILAQLGIDPDLEPLWPFPRSTGMYGNLWDVDTLSLGDRIGGPIMLARRGPSQIELLGGKRKHFSGN